MDKMYYYEALEREHLGDAEKQTGIYAPKLHNPVPMLPDPFLEAFYADRHMQRLYWLWWLKQQMLQWFCDYQLSLAPAEKSGQAQLTEADDPTIVIV
jgi:hypothetical protein